MRLITYQSETGPRIAAAGDGGYVDLNQADSALPTAMKTLLQMGVEGLKQAQAAITDGSPLDQQPSKLMAPVPDPQKVICIGLNYADHAAESGSPIPEEPVIFNKFPTAVRGHGDAIVLPKLSDQVDYEAELVVIIGKQGRHIPREQAFAHVAGYACGHDVSGRDWQLGKPGGQWLMGKSFDSFAPLGPELVTCDEVGDPGQLGIQLRLNGETMQDSNTKQLIFPVDQLVAYISGVCTLKPGDVIFTGTPPGVGFARQPKVLLKPGDVVEVEIERIGVLRNETVAE
ncbi:MAG: fumarylacetoacetate hydrolase family protein [Planctomycetes bacterium]|nr:fumarylacetoacetate hydrolase family protein [Planctomycetota bacterium]MBL7044941.1 fumarylacetoacetate hydrolase family protein [Pirellulaceae bacterium]